MKGLIWGFSPLLVVCMVASAAADSVPSNWKRFADRELGFEFRYPEFIQVKRKGDQIYLDHKIQFKHQSYCNETDPGFREEFTDLNIKIKVAKSKLRDLLNREKTNYVIDQFFVSDDNKSKYKSTFVEEVTLGNLKGTKITQGVKGCGSLVYFFPLSEDRVLVVRRSRIGELTANNKKRDRFLAQAGVIKPAREKMLVEKIANSVKLRKLPAQVSSPKPKKKSVQHAAVQTGRHHD